MTFSLMALLFSTERNLSGDVSVGVGTFTSVSESFSFQFSRVIFYVTLNIHTWFFVSPFPTPLSFHSRYLDTDCQTDEGQCPTISTDVTEEEWGGLVRPTSVSVSREIEIETRTSHVGYRVVVYRDEKNHDKSVNMKKRFWRKNDRT